MRDRVIHGNVAFKMETPMTLRIIGAKDVRALLTMDRAIELMREAMALVGRGETVQPLRSALWLPDKRGLLGLMPGYVAKPSGSGSRY